LVDRARHQTILPFTRYLAGQADYTTMIFTERRRNSTVTHQIATMAVFASPLLTIAAHPQSILQNPAADVIKSIPSVWDETIVLPDSRIGELAMYARRSGDTWFFAVMSGKNERISLQIPLSFLGEGRYNATIVRDDVSNPNLAVVDEKTAKRDEVQAIELGEGGGFVARFSRNK